MNVKKIFVAAAMVSVATLLSYADQGDTLISFCTPGPDKYADGQVVKDDEWYAICWAPDDGVFDGLTTACEPVNPAEELILAAPLAKDQKCPLTYFEFPRKDKYESGKFSILLLDTRNAGGKPAASNKYGRPLFMNAAEVAADASKASKMCVDVSAPTTVSGAAAKQAVLPVDTELAPAKIAAITITGANVQLTVSPFDESANYVVKMGTSVEDLNTYSIKVPANTSSGEKLGDSSNSATFIIPMEKGNFFSVGSVVK